MFDDVIIELLTVRHSVNNIENDVLYQFLYRTFYRSVKPWCRTAFIPQLGWVDEMQPISTVSV